MTVDTVNTISKAQKKKASRTRAEKCQSILLNSFLFVSLKWSKMVCKLPDISSSLSKDGHLSVSEFREIAELTSSSFISTLCS